MKPTITSKKPSNWVDRGEPPNPTLQRVLEFLRSGISPRQHWYATSPAIADVATLHGDFPLRAGAAATTYFDTQYLLHLPLHAPPIVFRSLTVLLFCQILAACDGIGHHEPADYEATAHFPHDPTAFTEGLVSADSVLFESTGLYGHSELRRVDLRSGRVLASRALPENRFGEGLALLKDRLYQLTWKAGVAYTYDAATLTPGDSLHYTGEGWGLTTDGTSLIMSDGSDSLRFLSPSTLQVERVIQVRYDDAPLVQLNELEYANGEVVANVYQTNWVVWIDPTTGVVREAIDVSDLYQNRSAFADVMNGIALAPDGQQLLLTGKRWPVLFQVQLRSPSAER